MGIINREGALYMATGVDNTGLYAGRREAVGIIQAMASQITSFDVFSGIGISAATAFAQAAKSAYDFEKEFQKNMLEVATISTQVEGSMTDFMNRVVAITQQIPVSAPEAAKALYQIVSAGHDGADGMQILEVSAKSAVGGLTDTATAADAITTILNAYKLSADKAANISDQLFTTVRLGKTDFSQLGTSIAQVAPIAAAYGIGIDEVLGAVASLTKQGVPTSQAMTQIRAAIQGASKELGDAAFQGRTFQESLQLITEKAGGSASKIKEMLGTDEGLAATLALTGKNAKAAASDLGELQNSAGATEAAFQKMQEDVDNQMKLLSNNIHAALRPFGEAILKEVSNVAQAFNEAFAKGEISESMRTLGDLIVIVTGALVGYKGSIIAVTAAKTLYKAVTDWIIKAKVAEASRIVLTGKAYAAEAAIIAKNTSVHILLTNALKAQAAAALKSAAAMLTNPYTLAAAAIAALGYTLYKYVTQATAAELVQKQLNKEQEEAAQRKQELTSKTDSLISKINSETESVYSQVKAYKELIKLFPELGNMTFEEFKTMPQSQQKTMLNKIEDERELEDAIKAYEADLKRIEYLKKVINATATLPNSSYALNKLNEELDKANNLAKLHKEEIEKIKQLQWEANTPVEEKVKHYEDVKQRLVDEKNELEKTLTKSEEVSNIWLNIPNIIDNIKLDVLNKRIDETSQKINSLTGKGEGSMLIVNKNKAYWEKQKKEAETALNDIDSKQKKLMDTGNFKGIDSKIVEKYKEQSKLFKEAEKELKVYDSSSKQENETAKRLKAQSDLSRSILESELKLQSSRIAIMQDGKDKRVLLADQEYKETLATIQKEREEYQKKINETKGKEDPAVLQTFTDREGVAKDKRNNNVAEITKEYDKEYRQRTKALTNVFLNEEQRKLSAIKTRYDQERKWANEQLKTGGMTDEEHTSYTVNIDKAQQQETYRSLLDNLNDYKQQEKNLREKWDTDIAAAVETKDAALITRLMEGKRKALSSLNSQMLQESSEWMRLFGNLDTLTVEELNKLIDSIQKQLNEGSLVLNPVDAKALMDSLNQAKEKVAEKNPFTALSKSSQDMKTALKELEVAEKSGLTGEQLDVYKKKVKDAAENVKKSISAIRDAYGQVSDVMKSAGDLIGMVDEGVGETVNNAIALGDAVMNVGEVVANAVIAFAAGMNAMESASVILLVIKAVLMAVMAAISLFNGDKKHEKKIKKLQGQVDKLSRAYDRLGEAIEDAYSTDKADLIDKESENLRQQNELIRQQIREEEDKKKTDQDKIKDWQNTIEDNNRQIEENSKKGRVEAIMGSDIKSAIDEFAQAYADAWAKGEKAAGKSADIVKSLIRTSIIEMLKKDLKPEVEAFMTFLSGVMTDGIITAAEQQQIDEWQKKLEEIADKSLAGKDKWLEDDNFDQLGITSDSIGDTILDGLKAGKSGIKDFSSSFEDMMRTAILNSLKTKYLEGPLKEFQKKFSELSESGGQLTEAEIEELRNMYADIIEGAKTQFDSLKEISGLDFSIDSDNSLKGAFAKASEESIGLLAGQTGAVRVLLEEMKNSMVPIREQMQLIYALQTRGWEDVRAIRELTDKVNKNSERVADNTREIKAVADKISDNTTRTVDALEGTLNVKVKM